MTETVRRTGALKQRVYDLLEVNGVDDHVARLIDRALVVLVIGNLLAVILQSVPEFDAQWHTLFNVVEWTTVTLFAVEYGLRVWVADLHPPLRKYPPWRARLAFMLRPAAIIDFLAFAPTTLGLVVGIEDLNVLVVFRLLRFLKLARYSPGMSSLLNAFIAERRALMASGVLMAGMILSSATLMHLIEGKVQPEKFGSIPAAMYWAVTTLATVGYGDEVPVTVLGKALASVTMLAGIIMFALPVGIMATAFAREIHNRDFVVTWSMVARVPIFAHLEASEIAEVARLLRAQTVEAGTVICHKDDPAFAMYFIATGTVEVDVPGQRVRLGEGAFFGEMAVLRKGRRSADVVALSQCRLLVLEAADLHMLMAKQSTLGAHIRAVAEERQRTGAMPGGDILREELDPRQT